jgi:hypothetical protein
MGLTYRKDKGSALTITELDDNFRHFTGSHSITGSLIVSSSSPCSIQLGDGSVFKVSNPTGSFHFSGSMGVTGSMNISGSGNVITSGNTGSLGNTTVSGSLTVTGSSIISGSLTVSGSTIYNYGPYHNYHQNVETFTISGSKVGINSTTPDYDLEILQASGATTSSFHISGALAHVKFENLPTTEAQASSLGTGSLWLSGSVQSKSKVLYVFVG